MKTIKKLLASISCMAILFGMVPDLEMPVAFAGPPTQVVATEGAGGGQSDYALTIAFDMPVDALGPPTATFKIDQSPETCLASGGPSVIDATTQAGLPGGGLLYVVEFPADPACLLVDQGSPAAVTITMYDDQGGPMPFATSLPLGAFQPDMFDFIGVLQGLYGGGGGGNVQPLLFSKSFPGGVGINPDSPPSDYNIGTNGDILLGVDIDEDPATCANAVSFVPINMSILSLPSCIQSSLDPNDKWDINNIVMGENNSDATFDLTPYPAGSPVTTVSNLIPALDLWGYQQDPPTPSDTELYKNEGYELVPGLYIWYGGEFDLDALERGGGDPVGGVMTWVGTPGASNMTLSNVGVDQEFVDPGIYDSEYAVWGDPVNGQPQYKQDGPGEYYVFLIVEKEEYLISNTPYGGEGVELMYLDQGPDPSDPTGDYMWDPGGAEGEGEGEGETFGIEQGMITVNNQEAGNPPNKVRYFVEPQTSYFDAESGADSTTNYKLLDGEQDWGYGVVSAALGCEDELPENAGQFHCAEVVYEKSLIFGGGIYGAVINAQNIKDASTGNIETLGQGSIEPEISFSAPGGIDLLAAIHNYQTETDCAGSTGDTFELFLGSQLNAETIVEENFIVKYDGVPQEGRPQEEDPQDRIFPSTAEPKGAGYVILTYDTSLDICSDEPPLEISVVINPGNPANPVADQGATAIPNDTEFVFNNGTYYEEDGGLVAWDFGWGGGEGEGEPSTATLTWDGTPLSSTLTLAENVQGANPDAYGTYAEEGVHNDEPYFKHSANEFYIFSDGGDQWHISIELGGGVEMSGPGTGAGNPEGDYNAPEPQGPSFNLSGAEIQMIDNPDTTRSPRRVRYYFQNGTVYDESGADGSGPEDPNNYALQNGEWGQSVESVNFPEDCTVDFINYTCVDTVYSNSLLYNGEIYNTKVKGASISNTGDSATLEQDLFPETNASINALGVEPLFINHSYIGNPCESGEIDVLDLYFGERLDIDSAQATGNYSLTYNETSHIEPQAAQLINSFGSRVRLDFGTGLGICSGGEPNLSLNVDGVQNDVQDAIVVDTNYPFNNVTWYQDDSVNANISWDYGWVGGEGEGEGEPEGGLTILPLGSPRVGVDIPLDIQGTLCDGVLGCDVYISDPTMTGLTPSYSITDADLPFTIQLADTSGIGSGEKILFIHDKDADTYSPVVNLLLMVQNYNEPLIFNPGDIGGPTNTVNIQYDSPATATDLSDTDAFTLKNGGADPTATATDISGGMMIVWSVVFDGEDITANLPGWTLDSGYFGDVPILTGADFQVIATSAINPNDINLDGPGREVQTLTSFTVEAPQLCKGITGCMTYLYDSASLAAGTPIYAGNPWNGLEVLDVSGLGLTPDAKYGIAVLDLDTAAWSGFGSLTYAPPDPYLNVTVTGPVAEDGGVGTITFAAGPSVDSDITIDISLLGSATVGVDYTLDPGTQVTIPANPGSPEEVQISVTMIGDEDVEENEFLSFNMQVSDPSYAVSNPYPFMFIADGAAPAPEGYVVNIFPVDNNGLENGGFFNAFDVVVDSEVTDEDLTVFLNLSGDADPGAGGDYEPVALAIVPIGQTSQLVQLNIINDENVEGDEMITMTIAPSATYNIGSNDFASFTIIDDDFAPPPTYEVNVTPYGAGTGVEGGGAGGAFDMFEIALDRPVEGDQFDVYFNFMNSTAIEGNDFAPYTYTVTFILGEQSKLINIPTIDDEDVEDDEFITLKLDSDPEDPDVYVVGQNNSANFTLTDNDVGEEIVVNWAADYAASKPYLDDIVGIDITSETCVDKVFQITIGDKNTFDGAVFTTGSTVEISELHDFAQELGMIEAGTYYARAECANTGTPSAPISIDFKASCPGGEACFSTAPNGDGSRAFLANDEVVTIDDGTVSASLTVPAGSSIVTQEVWSGDLLVTGADMVPLGAGLSSGVVVSVIPTENWNPLSTSAMLTDPALVIINLDGPLATPKAVSIRPDASVDILAPCGTSFLGGDLTKPGNYSLDPDSACFIYDGANDRGIIATNHFTDFAIGEGESITLGWTGDPGTPDQLVDVPLEVSIVDGACMDGDYVYKLTEAGGPANYISEPTQSVDWTFTPSEDFVRGTTTYNMRAVCPGTGVLSNEIQIYLVGLGNEVTITPMQDGVEDPSSPVSLEILFAMEEINPGPGAIPVYFDIDNTPGPGIALPGVDYDDTGILFDGNHYRVEIPEGQDMTSLFIPVFDDLDVEGLEEILIFPQASPTGDYLIMNTGMPAEEPIRGAITDDEGPEEIIISFKENPTGQYVNRPVKVNVDAANCSGLGNYYLNIGNDKNFADVTYSIPAGQEASWTVNPGGLLGLTDAGFYYFMASCEESEVTSNGLTADLAAACAAGVCMTPATEDTATSNTLAHQVMVEDTPVGKVYFEGVTTATASAAWGGDLLLLSSIGNTLSLANAIRIGLAAPQSLPLSETITTDMPVVIKFASAGFPAASIAEQKNMDTNETTAVPKCTGVQYDPANNPTAPSSYAVNPGESCYYFNHGNDPKAIFVATTYLQTMYSVGAPEFIFAGWGPGGKTDPYSVEVDTEATLGIKGGACIGQEPVYWVSDSVNFDSPNTNNLSPMGGETFAEFMIPAPDYTPGDTLYGKIVCPGSGAESNVVTAAILAEEMLMADFAQDYNGTSINTAITMVVEDQASVCNSGKYIYSLSDDWDQGTQLPMGNIISSGETSNTSFTFNDPSKTFPYVEFMTVYATAECSESGTMMEGMYMMYQPTPPCSTDLCVVVDTQTYTGTVMSPMGSTYVDAETIPSDPVSVYLPNNFQTLSSQEPAWNGGITVTVASAAQMMPEDYDSGAVATIAPDESPEVFINDSTYLVIMNNEGFESLENPAVTYINKFDNSFNVTQCDENQFMGNEDDPIEPFDPSRYNIALGERCYIYSEAAFQGETGNVIIATKQFGKYISGNSIGGGEAIQYYHPKNNDTVGVWPGISIELSADLSENFGQVVFPNTAVGEIRLMNDTTGLAVIGDWELFAEPWGYFVNFPVQDPLDPNTSYTVYINKTVADTNNSPVPALDDNGDSFSFTFTTFDEGNDDLGGTTFGPLCEPEWPPHMDTIGPIDSMNIPISCDKPVKISTLGGNVTVVEVHPNTLEEIGPASEAFIINYDDYEDDGKVDMFSVSGFSAESQKAYKIILSDQITGNTPIAGLDGMTYPYTNANKTFVWWGDDRTDYYSIFFVDGQDTGGYQSDFEMTWTNLTNYSEQDYIATAVPTTEKIEFSVNQPYNMATAVASNIKIIDSGEQTVSATIFHEDMAGGLIAIRPDTPLTEGETYQLVIGQGLKSLETQESLPETVYWTFTVGSTDAQAPRIDWAMFTEIGGRIFFNEHMHEIAAATKTNYTLYTCSSWVESDYTCSDGGSPAEEVTLTTPNIEFNYYDYNSTNGENNYVEISGLDLTPGNGYRIAVTGLTDVAGVAIESTADEWADFVEEYTNVNNDGEYDGETNLFSPVQVTPLNRTAGQISTYYVDWPVDVKIPQGGRVEYIFPDGFDVTSVKDMPEQSGVNADLNGYHNGNTVTFASESLQAGWTAGGDGSDGIMVKGTRTITYRLSAATEPSDYISSDMFQVLNTTMPGEYNIQIKTFDSNGLLLENKYSQMFDIEKSGDNSLSGRVTIANTNTGVAGVMLEIDKWDGKRWEVTTDASGDYEVTGLGEGDYTISTERAVIKLNGGVLEGVNDEWVYVNEDTTLNLELHKRDSSNGALTNITVNVGGNGLDDIDNLGAGDAIHLWAWGPGGGFFEEIKRSDFTNNSYTTSTYFDVGSEYSVGMGPALNENQNLSKIDWIAPEEEWFYIENTSDTASVTLTMTPATTDITGTVYMADGDTASNMEVSAFNNNGYHTFTTTDANGDFTLAVVDNMKWKVEAMKWGMAPSQEIPVVIKNGTTYKGGEEIESLDIYMKTSATITVQGAVSIDGTAIPWASVEWWRTDEPFQPIWGYTDANGNYTVNLIEGDWQAKVHVYEYGEFDPVTINNITESLENQDFNLSTSGNYATINVTVSGFDDNSGIEIWAEKTDNASYTDFFGKSGWTNSDGVVQMYVKPGTYKLRAHKPGSGDIGVTTAVGTADQTTNVAITAPDLQQFTVTVKNKGGSVETMNQPIHIDLWDETNGTGQYGSVPAGQSQIVMNAMEGTKFINIGMPGIPPDSVMISGAAYNATNRTVTINGSSNDITVTIPQLYSVSGQVVDQDGNGIDAWVNFMNEEEGKFMGTPSYYDAAGGGESGEFSTSIPSGTYEVFTESGEGGAIPATLTVNADLSDYELEITLYDYTITGTLTDPSGTAVTEGHVWGQNETGQVSATPLNYDGTFTLPVNEGTWSFQGHSWGYGESAEKEVSITGNTATTLQLTTITEALKEPVASVIDENGGTISDSGTGTEIQFPSSALPDGNNNITTREDNAVFDGQSSGPVGNGQAIEATDSTGSSITTPDDEVKIVLKTTYEELTDESITTVEEANQMINASWDSSTNNWETVTTTNAFYDSADQTISYTSISDLTLAQSVTNYDLSYVKSTSWVDHFTTFAPVVPIGGDAAPSAPSGFSIVAGDTEAALTWTANSEGDMDYYNIWEAEVTEGVHSTFSQASCGATCSTTITGLTNDTEYIFQILAVDDGANQSAGSSSISVTPVAEPTGEVLTPATSPGAGVVLPSGGSGRSPSRQQEQEDIAEFIIETAKDIVDISAVGVIKTATTVISADQLVNVTFEKNTTILDGDADFSAGLPAPEIVEVSTPAPENTALVGNVYEIGLSDTALILSKPVAIRIQVPQGFNENDNLKIHYLDEENDEWVMVEDGGDFVDIDDDLFVEVEAYHLTKFSIIKLIEAIVEDEDDFDETPVVVTPPTAVSFSDIATHWAKEYIESLYAAGVIKGKTSTEFAPEAEVLRAEMVKLAIEGFNILLTTTGPTPYTDVGVNDWYIDYFRTTDEYDITEANEDGSILPAEPLTRAETIEILLKSSGLNIENPTTSSFSDVSVDHWGLQYIETAASLGIVSGYADGSFGPEDPVTRAEATKMLSKTMKLKKLRDLLLRWKF
ncbi:hypothetical protein HOC54_01330 [Candidatus Peregrinibacteria bacterium]|nr:hypothetical protein [Candidatus Peregrinibacteria bacterium]